MFAILVLEKIYNACLKYFCYKPFDFIFILIKNAQKTCLLK